MFQLGNSLYVVCSIYCGSLAGPVLLILSTPSTVTQNSTPVGSVTSGDVGVDTVIRGVDDSDALHSHSYSS